MKKYLTLSAAFFALWASQVSATTITNMDVKPHDVIVNDGGHSTKITIQPQDIYTTKSNTATYTVEGQEPMEDTEDSEFAIWPDGWLVKQTSGHAGHYR